MEEKNFDNLSLHFLKNDVINVCLIPKLGGKIISFNYKREFDPIFSKEKYDKPYDYNFAKYDTSGIDDCLPTIDECTIKGNNNILPDHGEVWANEMEVVSKDEKSIELRYKLKSVPLIFNKKIILENNSLMIRYRIEAVDKTPYLWAFHGLMKLEGCKKLYEPDNDGIIQVDGAELPKDYRNLSDYTENKTYKFYYKSIINHGEFMLEYDSHILKYNYDNKMLPYVGIWITSGGFKGEKNLAIEPCNGFYDSLSNAIENNKFTVIDKNQVHEWYVKLSIERK